MENLASASFAPRRRDHYSSFCPSKRPSPGNSLDTAGFDRASPTRPAGASRLKISGLPDVGAPRRLCPVIPRSERGVVESVAVRTVIRAAVMLEGRRRGLDSLQRRPPAGDGDRSTAVEGCGRGRRRRFERRISTRAGLERLAQLAPKRTSQFGPLPLGSPNLPTSVATGLNQR